MIDMDRDEFRAAARAVVRRAQQRLVAQTQQIATASPQQMGKTHAGSRTVEIRNLPLEPDRPRLPLAYAKTLARSLLLQLDQRSRGGIVKTGHAVRPAHIDEIAFDRRHGANRLVGGVDAGQRAYPGRREFGRCLCRRNAALAAPGAPECQVRAERAPCIGRPTPQRGIEEAFIDRRSRSDQCPHVLDQIRGLARKRRQAALQGRCRRHASSTRTIWTATIPSP